MVIKNDSSAKKSTKPSPSGLKKTSSIKDMLSVKKMTGVSYATHLDRDIVSLKQMMAAKTKMLNSSNTKSAKKGASFQQAVNYPSQYPYLQTSHEERALTKMSSFTAKTTTKSSVPAATVKNQVTKKFKFIATEESPILK